MRAMCLLGGAFFEGQFSLIPRSRCQADVAVAKWCKSVSASGGTLLEKWNDAMSPLNPPLFPDPTDRRSDWRVSLYNSILRKAEENLKSWSKVPYLEKWRAAGQSQGANGTGMIWKRYACQY